MAKDTLTITDNRTGKTYELPINEGTIRALDLRRLKAALAAPVVVDLRNVYRPEEMRRHGFTYVSIGRT